MMLPLSSSVESDDDSLLLGCRDCEEVMADSRSFCALVQKVSFLMEPMVN